MTQIIVENLSKSFSVAQRRPGVWGAVSGLLYRQHKKVQALEDISFTLAPGELVGYIGPNGAGKSTTVKILSGILVPDGGRVEILGRTPWRQRIAHVGQIGVVFGQRTQLWYDLPVIESLDLLQDIYSIPPEKYRQAKNELIELLELGDFLDTPVRQLSLGQRMRADLAASLLHAPPILFLDEPTIGLDAVSKLAVRDFIKSLNRNRGTTVILTTHDMDDIEALCSRIMVIGKGKILSDSTLSALRQRVTPERRLILDLTEAGTTITDPDATVLKHEAHRVHLSYNPERISTPALISRLTAKYAIRDLTVENPPIEEIIARLYTNEGLR